MKTLKFAGELPELVLAGKKDTTWRIDDEKDITIEDILSFCRPDGIEFARGKVRWVKCTRFEYLSEEDKEGHEPFSKDEEMYDTYSRYYNMKVTPETPVKIIKYKLIQST